MDFQILECGRHVDPHGVDINKRECCMTNQSLRERFHVSENKSAIVTQVIAAAIEAGQIKPDETVGTSRRFARYIPFWA